MRPVVVFGLLHAGLSIVRCLGRQGIPVHGVALRPNEFGLRSRYLATSGVVAGEDGLLKALRAAAAGGERPVLFPERDENVEMVLNRWDDVARARRRAAPGRSRGHDAPPPQGRPPAGGGGGGRRLPARRCLPRAPSRFEPRACARRSSSRRSRARSSPSPSERRPSSRPISTRRSPAGSGRRERGFDTIVQELVPDSHEDVWSLFTYIARDGEPRASVVGRKVRQGPLRFGTSAVFTSALDPEVHRLGQRLLRARRLHGPGARRARPRPARRSAQAARGEHPAADLGRDRDGAGARHGRDRVRGPLRRPTRSPSGRSATASPGSTWRRTSGSPPRWHAGASCTRASSCATTWAGRRCAPSSPPTTRGRRWPASPISAPESDADRARRPAGVHPAVRPRARLGARPRGARSHAPDLAVPARRGPRARGLRPRGAVRAGLDPSLPPRPGPGSPSRGSSTGRASRA